MMQQISIYLTSIILGIMLFFSFVVAPVTFTALDEENARKFIRKIFPYYYTVNLAISISVLICFIILKIFSLDFYLILSGVVLFAVSNFVLMPLINKFRDEKQDKKFELEVGAKDHHKINLEKYIKNFDTNKVSVGEDNILSKLSKLKKLYDNGVLTEDEFKKAKNKILN